MTENGYSSTPGNTIQESHIKSNKNKISKKRHFQLTLNCEDSDNIEDCKNILLDKYNKLKDYLLSLQYNYFISCLEINKKGYYHIHIYIQFNTPRQLSIKKCQGAHIEFCRGSADENKEYIIKDGNILDEIGNMRNYRGGSTIKDIMLSTDSDQLLDYDMKYINCINKIKNKSISWNQPLFNTEKNIYFNLNKAPHNSSIYSKDNPIKNTNIVFIINNFEDLIFLCEKLLYDLNISYKEVYAADINNIYLRINKYYPPNIIDKERDNFDYIQFTKDIIKNYSKISIKLHDEEE